MRVVGLDLSLTCTGVAVEEGEGRSFTIEPARRRGMERLDFIREGVLTYAAPGALNADIVVIEGYSFNSKQGGEHLGELGGVVRLALWDLGIRFVDVSPASLKTYATGKGNAKKEVVFAAAIRRLGYEGNDHNEADALWLRAMALDHYGEQLVDMPQDHRRALEKVEWPTMPGIEDSVSRHPAGSAT
jgi:crossover junction endodeoxyribonuclease RuvC